MLDMRDNKEKEYTYEMSLKLSFNHNCKSVISIMKYKKYK